MMKLFTATPAECSMLALRPEETHTNCKYATKPRVSNSAGYVGLVGKNILAGISHSFLNSKSTRNDTVTWNNCLGTGNLTTLLIADCR